MEDSKDSNYEKGVFIFQFVTKIDAVKDNISKFFMGDYNNDNYDDLFYIHLNKQNKTEIQILSGKSQYQDDLLQTELNLPPIGKNFDIFLGNYKEK